jgi:enoyl-CoA hydratase/carnithine racemase
VNADPSEPDPVLLEIDNGVAVVSLNRPHRHNAANDAMDERFFEILGQIHADTEVRCVVIRGEGKSLSSGRDTAELGKRSNDESQLSYIERGHAKTRLLWSLDCPTIVAMKGWTIGGWFERALLCDIRIASEDARMALPEVTHGVVPDTGGTTRLFQIAGHGLAADLALTGRVLTASEALTHGIVSRVVPADQLDALALSMATTIASRSPLAVKFTKQVLSGLGIAAVEASMNEERLSQVLIYASEDYREQSLARAEERPPEFRGR